MKAWAIYNPDTRHIDGVIYDSYEEAAADLDDRLADHVIISFDDGLLDDWVYVIMKGRYNPEYQDVDSTEPSEERYPSKAAAQEAAKKAVAELIGCIDSDITVFVCHEDEVDQEIEDRLTRLGKNQE